ncbi:hypothetical protein PFNF135_00683 [Plasmodium falciparum NF135/5.C10]|uniref:Surface antigen n=1 Tax=Plasmodium falciparum NF135/5.C10 TaxID=1036726 RepID=W4IMF9_PLAFA|nr:hypothetical protein PFNF135_00683 [Plasmodium falciparum NF135/5.C10]
MQQFHDRTTQRFQEYDEKLQEKRQICKEQCDKEIQKIILKDKIEKELNEKFSALHTDIQSDDIPTCICEKSLADKVEKGCLRCGSILGAAMPELGSVGGSLLYALNTWKPAAIIAAKEAAEKLGIAAGKIAGEARGMAIVITGLRAYGVHELCPELLQSIGSKIPYNDASGIIKIILEQHVNKCGFSETTATKAMCNTINTNFKLIQIGNQPYYPTKDGIKKGVTEVVGKATQTAEAKAAQVSSETSSKILTKQTDVINTIYMSNQTAIIASIIAIIIIVSIMVIIYLILRYRRKKKMKKKLLYIKLLEE